MRRIARLLFRAPAAAVLVLALVVVAAALDEGDAPAQPIAAADTSTTTTISVAVPTTSPASRPYNGPIGVREPTFDITGDDDPEAIDGRSWTWDQLADCESGAWGANKVPKPGTARWDAVREIYQGGLQFDARTWDAYKEPGFAEDAHLASREQQIVVAENVIARQGPRAWPTCAPRLGMIGPDLPLDDPLPPSVPLAEPLP